MANAKANYNLLEQELLPSQLGSTTKESSPIHTKLKKMGTISFYSSLALFSFFIFLVSHLELDKIATATLDKAFLMTNLNWSADKITVDVFPSLHLKLQNFHIRPLPYNFGKAISIPLNDDLFFPYLSISPSALDAIPIPGIRPMTTALHVSSQIFQGKVKGKLLFNTKELDLKLNGSGIDLHALTTTLKSLGFEATGTSILSMQLNVPNSRYWSKANGNAQIKINKFTLDLYNTTKAFNMNIPELDLGEATADVSIVNGRVDIKNVHIGGAKADLDLNISGSIILKDQLANSILGLKLKLKPAQKLLQSVPFLDGLLVAAKGNDGYSRFNLNGTIGSPGIPTPDR